MDKNEIKRRDRARAVLRELSEEDRARTLEFAAVIRAQVVPEAKNQKRGVRQVREHLELAVGNTPPVVREAKTP